MSPSKSAHEHTCRTAGSRRCFQAHSHCYLRRSGPACQVRHGSNVRVGLGSLPLYPSALPVKGVRAAALSVGNDAAVSRITPQRLPYAPKRTSGLQLCSAAAGCEATVAQCMKAEC
jgi:hypothetical protein